MLRKRLIYTLGLSLNIISSHFLDAGFINLHLVMGISSGCRPLYVISSSFFLKYVLKYFISEPTPGNPWSSDVTGWV